MRKVFRGGVIGGLPGLLIAIVPLVLHDMNVISSDQSQIGFIGIPLLFLGVLVGSYVGASGTASTGRVMLGVVAGFFVGIALGVGMSEVLRSAGATVPGFWLFLTPMMMIGGGMVGAWWGEHAGPPHQTQSQH